MDIHVGPFLQPLESKSFENCLLNSSQSNDFITFYLNRNRKHKQEGTGEETITGREKILSVEFFLMPQRENSQEVSCQMKERRGQMEGCWSTEV